MEQHARYEILKTIGKGDFATVFRGRDNDLGREVAIKQIHQQFLDDPQQLERYWREAQIMATLQHPHIMTIYDVVRERGWLILELMQGSLKQLLGGRPIDLNDLRYALTYTLQALDFLEKNGIIHGDVKPGNLLVDQNHRVKLGDFGIARRIAGDDGSVVKGTTKYMAPEVVSDQFGEVGPASDLYSLGFSAFELMCGENFDSLFPGLNMFGRDQQIAWMMWHSAPDRRLPEIRRVLQGVPEDLAHVIQKLTEKDPAKRYPTARQAMRDLRGVGQQAGVLSAGREEESEEPAKGSRRKRIAAIAALTVSVCLSVAALLLPTGAPKPQPAAVAQRPMNGIVAEIDLQRSRFFLRTRPGSLPEGVLVRPKVDRIRLNDAPARLEDLDRGDEITIHYLTREDGSRFMEIDSTRPLAVEQSGLLTEVNAGAGMIRLAPADGQEPIQIYVPAAAAISLNGSAAVEGRSVELTDLEPQDRAAVRYVPGEDRREARSIDALRQVALKGVLVSVDLERRRVAVRVGDKPNAPRKLLPVSPDCLVTLNGVQTIDGKVLTLADLKADDQVAIQHDAQATRIDAQRLLIASGVAKRVDCESRKLFAAVGGNVGATEFSLAPDCAITILATGRAVDLTYVRTGDRVQITHDAPDLKNAHALAIAVDAEPDPRAWAVVIGQQEYDDQRVSRLRTTAADAQLVRDALAAEYRVPSNQLLLLIDPTRTRLQQQLSQFLPKVASDGQLIVYYVGRAYVDDTGAPFLAPKGIDLSDIAGTGVSLRWLVDQMEAAPASEKLLLLDTCREGSGRDRKWRLSAAELVERLKPTPQRAPSLSVTIVASCAKGEQGMAAPQQDHGLFAFYTAAALAGQADGNRDHRVHCDELFSFLKTKMAGVQGPRGRVQTPDRFLPNPTPPRLSSEAVAAVRRMLGRVSAGGLDDTVQDELLASLPLAPGQPDLELAYALANLKHNKTSVSLRMFETIRREHPETLLAHYALAWQHFMGGDLRRGVADLTELVRRLPPPRSDQPIEGYEAHALEFAGQLRQFALQAAEPRLTIQDVSKLDQAVLDRDEASGKLFKKGIDDVTQAIGALDQQIQNASADNVRSRLARDRQRLTYYARFDFDAAADYLQKRLEQ